MPDTWAATRHVMKSPRRQESQYPQCPPCHPTPTRCPDVHPRTPRHCGGPLKSADGPQCHRELSGVSERPMIIPMTTTGRLQQRYDHRLRDLVRGTGDVTSATDLGDPPS